MTTFRSTPDDVFLAMRVNANRNLFERERAHRQAQLRLASLSSAIASEKAVITSMTAELAHRGLSDDLPDSAEQRLRDHAALLALSAAGTVLIDGGARWTLLPDGMWRPADGSADLDVRQLAELIAAEGGR